MSEYICTNKFDTNECPNLFVKEKLIRTNVRIFKYICHTLVSVVNIKTNQIIFVLLSLAVLCRFVFFYISFVSWRLPRLTVFRLSEEVVRKPELFFVSTLCVLSNVSHLHSEEEGNHLLGWDELFWKEENHTNNLSSIQMFYCKYIRFWYLMLCSTFQSFYWCLIGGEIPFFNRKWDNSIFKSLWEYGNKW